MTCPVYTNTVAYTGQLTFYNVPSTRRLNTLWNVLIPLVLRIQRSLQRIRFLKFLVRILLESDLLSKIFRLFCNLYYINSLLNFFFYKKNLLSSTFKYDFLMILVSVLLFKDPDFFPDLVGRTVSDPQQWFPPPMIL